ncbi:MAG: SpoIID/LytB domain-containing protein, partial [Acidimicrobiales bacterium]
MRRLGRLGAATLLLFLTTAALAPRAEAAKAEAARSGWLATSVRFEPIDAASSGPIEVDEVGLYRGAIEVVPAPAGVAVINHVDVEDYVRGISEVPPTWPAEAQRAQAIAARTYALWEWNRTGVSAAYKDLGADICATDACQVYRGVVRERQDDSAGWLAAVDATRSRAIYWRDAPIKAMYSSSNGGIMAAGAERYLRGGVDPDDRWSPLHRWSVTLDLARVVEAAELPPATKSIHRDGDTIWAVAPGLDGPALAALPVNEFRLRLNRGLD